MKIKKKNKKRNIIICSTVGLIVALGIFTYCTQTNKKPRSGVIPVVTEKSTSDKAVVKKNDNVVSTTKANNDDAVSMPMSDKSSPVVNSATSSSTSRVAPPSGNFVSNHRPNLDGEPAPSGEQSVCITTPGATCYVKFVQNGIIKTLPTQTADPSGSVYWDWDIDKAGFSPGVWEITAVATLNGENKSVTDPMSLEVKP